MAQHLRSKHFILGALAMSGIALSTGREIGGLVFVAWSLFCLCMIMGTAKGMSEVPRRAFTTLGVGGILSLVAVIIRSVHGEVIGVDQPLPSPADVVLPFAYCMFFAVVIQLHKARSTRADVDAWVDSLSFSISLAALLWALFFGEFLFEVNQSPLELGLNLFYTLVPFFTLAVALRIGAMPGIRSVAYRMLGAGCAAFLLTELSATWALATSGEPYLTVALSPLVYGFCTAAAIHPSVEETFQAADRAENESTKLRSLFILGSLTAPIAIIIFGDSTNTQVRYVALALSALVAMLVSFRVFRLLSEEAAARNRERILAEELARLATIPSIEELRSALPISAGRITAGSHSVRESDSPIAHSTQFELPEPLRSEGVTSALLTVIPAFTSSQEKRLIDTLVRESGHFASALEATVKLERQKSAAAAAELTAGNERRLRILLQNSADTIVVFKRDTGVVTFVSESVGRMLGYSPEDFVGKTMAWMTYEQDWNYAVRQVLSTERDATTRTQYEVRVVDAAGTTRLLECSIADMTDVDGIEGMVMNATDRTQIRELESDLLSAETIDPLTSLLNRGAFIKEIDAAARRASVRESSVAIAVIDIDDFRSVNDGYGTALGDRVLLKLASRIKRIARSDDPIARLGGDRFGVLFPSGYSTREVETLLERILEAVNEPVSIEGHTIVLSATSGVFIDADFDSDAVTVLGHADTALDAAKQAHRGGLLHFRSEMGLEASTRIEIRNRLREALSNDGLRLNFQPVVDLGSGKIVSLEALARWSDPVLGDISPGTFIPVAESSGLILDLGDWALTRACEHLSEWSDLGFGDINVSVNMSGHQLRDDRTIDRFKAILDQTKVDSSRITIEITESVLLDDTNFTAQRIQKLRRLGFKLAIDDFGTGYSSFGYLRRYEFDIVKIDRSFVSPLASDHNTREREIVNAMIKLSQALGAITIAEGIEQSEEHAVLRTLGCDQAQGFLFCGPTEAQDIPQLLSKEIDPSIIDI